MYMYTECKSCSLYFIKININQASHVNSTTQKLSSLQVAPDLNIAHKMTNFMYVFVSKDVLVFYQRSQE